MNESRPDHRHHIERRLRSDRRRGLDRRIADRRLDLLAFTTERRAADPRAAPRRPAPATLPVPATTGSHVKGWPARVSTAHWAAGPKRCRAARAVRAFTGQAAMPDASAYVPSSATARAATCRRAATPAQCATQP